MEKPTLGGLSFSIHLRIWKTALKMKRLYKPTHLQSWINWFYSLPCVSKAWGMHWAREVLQPPQRFPTAGGELRNSFFLTLVGTEQNWQHSVRARSQQKDWQCFLTLEFTFCGGATSTSPKISVQTDWERKSHLPPSLGRARAHRAHRYAANTQEQGPSEKAALSSPSTPPLLPASTEGSEGLQCKSAHNILGYFCPTAFKNKSFTNQSCTAFSSLLGKLLTVKPSIWLHTHIVSLLCFWAAGMLSCLMHSNNLQVAAAGSDNPRWAGNASTLQSGWSLSMKCTRTAAAFSGVRSKLGAIIQSHSMPKIKNLFPLKTWQ